MHTVLPIVLLVVSNVFMTLAWYGHLRFMKGPSWPMFLVVLASWGIAFLEYCFQVPANRLGYGFFTAFQLKIIQEVISLTVFSLFVWALLGEKLRWNHALAFLLLLAATALAFYKPADEAQATDAAAKASPEEPAER